MLPELKVLQNVTKTLLKNKPPGCTFYFVRKGESIANQSGSLAGWLDAKLTFQGRKQANNICSAIFPMMKQFDGYYSSDLQRYKLFRKCHILTGFILII